MVTDVQLFESTDFLIDLFNLFNLKEELAKERWTQDTNCSLALRMLLPA
jgi:hypothetical protein